MLAVLALTQVVVAKHHVYVVIGTILDGSGCVGDRLDLVGAAIPQDLPHGQSKVLKVVDDQVTEFPEVGADGIASGFGHDRFCFSNLLTSARNAAGFTGL
jgi:hypothetical protein